MLGRSRQPLHAAPRGVWPVLGDTVRATFESLIVRILILTGRGPMQPTYDSARQSFKFVITE